MRFPRTALAGLVLAATTATAADFSEVPSGMYALDSTHAYINFQYNHLGFSNPTLSFDDFTVDLFRGTGPMEFDPVPQRQAAERGDRHAGRFRPRYPDAGSPGASAGTANVRDGRRRPRARGSPPRSEA